MTDGDAIVPRAPDDDVDTDGAHAEEITRWGAQARDWYGRAVLLREGGRPQLAADLLSRVLVLEPTSAFLRDEVAVTQFRAGQYVGAWVTFTAMTAVDRNDGYAYYGLGMTEARLGELAGAQLHLLQAVAKDPADRRYRAALKAVREALADGHPVSPPADPPDAAGRLPSPVVAPQIAELELAPRVAGAS